MDSVSWLIEILRATKPGNMAGRKAFELLCRVDTLQAHLSPGMRRRLQRAILKGETTVVEEVLRALGVDEITNEVDAELALTDHLTGKYGAHQKWVTSVSVHHSYCLNVIGIVLVDPVTLGCGHAFSKAALLEHLNRLQVHRTCPLCRWEVPASFELKVDPLLSYVLSRYGKNWSCA